MLCVLRLLANDLELLLQFGRTLLHSACRNGYANIAAFLIERGASLYAVDNDGSTPLHGACVTGMYECVRILMEKGADASIKNTVFSVLK
jgi:ankyrin repeat protein